MRKKELEAAPPSSLLPPGSLLRQLFEADLIIFHAELRSRIDGILTPEQRIMAAMLPLLQPAGPERGPSFEHEQIPALGRCGQGGLEPAPGRPTTADGDWEPEICFERR
jgi:hypothetical protein